MIRQFQRISDAISDEQLLPITPLSSTNSPYTVIDRDKVILADTASGAITVNLPVGKDQRVIYIKNIASSGANLVTITPNGSDDIDRLGVSFDLGVMDSVRLQYSDDEANWFIL